MAIINLEVKFITSKILQENLFLKHNGRLLLKVNTFRLSEELKGHKALIKKDIFIDNSRFVKILEVRFNSILVETENNITAILREKHIECLLIEVN